PCARRPTPTPAGARGDGAARPAASPARPGTCRRAPGLRRRPEPRRCGPAATTRWRRWCERTGRRRRRPAPRGRSPVPASPLRARIARRAPAVEELLGGAGAAQVLGDEGPIADDYGRGTVASGGLVAATGQAGADVGRDHERRSASAQGGGQGTDGGPNRPA